MGGNGTFFTNAIYLCQGSVFILSVVFSSEVQLPFRYETDEGKVCNVET